ncbi:MAG: 50S ribosomal protein L1 [Planctomycetes bacterium]|nr:50S ribosomal protein L1 [Planctomycetota bacterium]
MGMQSKRYRKEAATVSPGDLSVKDAVDKIKSFTSTKFDQTVDLVLHLGIDSKQAEQLVRGAISLPHGTGKKRTVIAFCEDGDAEEAKKAGAVEAGLDDLVKKVSDGWLDFDVAIASPRVMGKVGKLGRVLGPQGKMPSPKNGTVTQDVTKAVGEFTAGKVEFRNDAGGNVHVLVGKQSFESAKLIENIEAFVAHIIKSKPSGAKGTYVKKVSLSATMSPSVQVDV